jgi:hypothetical protein
MIKHTWKSFNNLTNRGKCLYMWRWLRDHPHNGKRSFFLVNFGLDTHIPEQCKEVEGSCGECQCYACVEVGDVVGCEPCPITWITNTQKYSNTYCNGQTSPYFLWNMDGGKENAQAVLDTIINTWKV